MMFIKHYAPQQMLVHKGGQINNVQLITGLRIAGRGGGGGGVGLGGQGGCERRSKVFVKIQKKKKKLRGGGSG